MSLTRALAEYAFAADPISAAARHAAKRAVLDTLTVAVAGMSEPSVGAALGLVHADGPADGPAHIWGTGQSGSTIDAAFVNGVASHALDLDDVSMSMWGHPSTVLVPVVAAAAEANGRSIGDLIDAYVRGLHVDLAVAKGCDLVRHYDRGWHASVTIGLFGAVAAAASLYRLTVDQTAHALGIAASMTAGTRENFGTITKALHIGLASANAIRAVLLAREGADSSPVALEGPRGFYELVGEGRNSAESVRDFLTGPEMDSLKTLNNKRYPCCYQTHRAIDAAIDLADGPHRWRADSIDHVTVHVTPGSDNSLIYVYAATPTQARFCMRYIVAKALLERRVTFETFTESAVDDQDIQDLMRRIDVIHASESPDGDAREYATVTVVGTDRPQRRVTCLEPRGGAARPLSDDEVISKAQNCLAHGHSAVSALGLWNGLDEADLAVVEFLNWADRVDARSTQETTKEKNS